MKLKYLKIYNLFCFSSCFIDFTLYGNAIVSIEGVNEKNNEKSNGTGKTSVPEIINWCLFDETIKGIVTKDKNKIIRYGQKVGGAELCFINNESEIRIIKERKKGKTLISIYDGERDLGIKNITEGKRYIEGLLGITFEVWKNTMILGQNASSLFLEGTPKEKTDLFGDMLNFGVFDMSLALVRKKASSVDAELKLAQNTLETLEQAIKDSSVYRGFEVTNASLVELDTKIEKENVIIADAKEALKSVEKTRELPILVSKINSIKLKIKDQKKWLTSKEKEALEEKEKLEKDLDESKVVKLTEVYNKINEEVAKIKDSRKKYEEKEIKLRAEKSTKETELEELESLIEVIETKGYSSGERCLYCGQVIDEKCLEEIKDKTAGIITGLDHLREEVSICVQKKLEANKEILKLKETQGEHPDTLKARLSANRATAERVDKNLIEHKKQYENRRKELIKEGKALKEKYDELKALKQDEERSYDTLVSVLESSKNTKETYVDIKKGIEARLEVIKNNKIRLEEASSKNLPELKTEYIKYKRLEKFFGLGGARTHLINKIAPVLEYNINEYLREVDLSQWRIELDLQDSMAINVYVDEEQRPIDLLSGGERKFLSLLFNLSLSEVILQRGLGFSFQFFDEAADNLDQHNTVLFFTLLNTVCKRFDRQIFVTTHSSFAKDIIDAYSCGRIVVSKNGGSSTIEQKV